MSYLSKMLVAFVGMGAFAVAAPARADLTTIYSDPPDENLTVSVSAGTPLGSVNPPPVHNLFTPLAESGMGYSVNAFMGVKFTPPTIIFPFRTPAAPDPQVSISLSPFLPQGVTGTVRFGADAAVTWFFSVANKDDPSNAPIKVTLKGHFFGGDPMHVTDAGVLVATKGTTFLQEDEYSDPNAGGDIDLSFPANQNQVYEVRYEASGATCVTGIPNETCSRTPSDISGVYTSGIDPYLTIDPSNGPGDYVLTLSAGLNPAMLAVPEAPAWAMALLGFAAVAALGAARGRSARAASSA
jgi:hypothetical protein